MNRSIHTALGPNTTPFEKLMGTKPDLKNVPVFGQHRYVMNQSNNRRKLNPKARKYQFVGFSGDGIFKYWKPESRQVLESRNVAIVPLLESGGESENLEFSQEDSSTNTLAPPGTPRPSSPHTPPTTPKKLIQPKTSQKLGKKHHQIIHIQSRERSTTF